MIRTVDLFCGCGGIAVGFELHDGALRYETVLGADIDPAALRIFNHNLCRQTGRVRTGRRVDLSWFNHRSEVLLYYLSHLALWEPDRALVSALNRVRFDEFLGQLRALDEAFARTAREIADASEYRAGWRRVDAQVASLALYKAVLRKLGLSSLSSPSRSEHDLPWIEEYRAFDSQPAAVLPEPHPSLLEAARELWTAQVGRLGESAAGNGRGQHRAVAGRMATLSVFLGSPAGSRLRDGWIDWRARRDSLRASFCLTASDELQRLYDDERQIQLVLGGPPCKGWSRIGRAVIEDLRSQGVHAWASREYGDERNALLHNYVLFLDALRPDAFLFENVAHFRSRLRTPSGTVHAAEVLEEAIEELTCDHMHYDVESHIVRARQHGVPQDRERFILVGIRGADADATWIREFFHELPKQQEEVPLRVALMGLDDPAIFDPADRKIDTKHTTAAYTLIDPRMPRAHREYLEWIRRPRSGRRKGPSTVDGHIIRKGRADDQALYEYLAPGKRWMDYKLGGMKSLVFLRGTLEDAKASVDYPSAEGLRQQIDKALSILDDGFVLRLLLEALAPSKKVDEQHHLLSGNYLAKGTDRHGDWLERLSPDQPCKTIVAHIGKDTYGYIHPYQARALSVREAARVQSFPDWFSLGQAGVVDAYSVIGNAVPPLLANLFARQFERLHLAHRIFQTGEDGSVSVEAGPTALALNGV